MTIPPDLHQRLRAHGQEHLLHGWEALDHDTRAQLIEHARRIDFAELESLQKQATAGSDALPENIEPVPITPAEFTREERAYGEDSLRRGQVAALLVAGGQGSRLGVAQPKGMFPAGPVSGASLYQIHAEKVLAASRKYGRPVPFLVMTSPATDADTRAFFAENRNFGLAPEQVRFFEQGTMPAVCLKSGRVLLEEPGKLFLSPNGHGGTLTALADSGLLEEVVVRGVKHVFYFQVDNPLVKVCDPGFIGRHAATGSEASSKIVTKSDPAEKVGVLTSAGSRCTIIEYTLLPKHLAERREPTGELSFRAGSPAIHIFSVPFLERVTRTAAGSLPYRTALKAVSHYDPEKGENVPAPKEPNAVKFERFIFDALPHAEKWLAVETPRHEEFAPIKNASGPDSPETARAAQVALFTEWLRRAGFETHGHPVEVSPLFALDADELAEKLLAETVPTQQPKLSGPKLFR